MLYRLDYIDVRGNTDPVRHPVFGGVLLHHSWTGARKDALNIAGEEGRHVAITRIAGASTMRRMAIASPETGRIHTVKHYSEREDW